MHSVLFALVFNTQNVSQGNPSLMDLSFCFFTFLWLESLSPTTFVVKHNFLCNRITTAGALRGG